MAQATAQTGGYALGDRQGRGHPNGWVVPRDSDRRSDEPLGRQPGRGQTVAGNWQTETR